MGDFVPEMSSSLSAVAVTSVVVVRAARLTSTNCSGEGTVISAVFAYTYAAFAYTYAAMSHKRSSVRLTSTHELG